MREQWPEDKPLAIRLSCTDYYEGGWTLDETIELAKILKTEGIDLIDCSGGGGTPLAKIPVGPCYQVPLSQAVRGGAGVPTGTVGMITQAWQAGIKLSETARPTWSSWRVRCCASPIGRKKPPQHSA